MQGLVKLADFGVASRLGEIADEEDPAAIAVVGTPYWMAPEVRLPSAGLCANGVIHYYADGESAATVQKASCSQAVQSSKAAVDASTVSVDQDLLHTEEDGSVWS